MRKINRKKRNLEIDLIRMLWPIFLELIITAVIGNVNQLILNRFSENAVAATTAAAQFLTLTTNMYTIFSVGQSILLASLWGAGKDREGMTILRSSLFANMGFAAVLSLIGSAAVPTVVQWLNMPEELRNMGQEYLRVMVSCSVFQAITLTLSAALRAMGQMKAVMMGNLLINGSCVGMNYLILRCVPKADQTILLYALAGVISQILGGLLFYVLLRKDRRVRFLYANSEISFSKLRAEFGKAIVRIVRLGFLGGMEGVIYLISQTAVMSMIGILGTQALIVKGYTGNLITYMTLPAGAVPLAAATMIGMAAGRHQERQMHDIFAKCLKVSLILTGGICIISIMSGRAFLSAYTSDSEILNLCMKILLIDCGLELTRCFAALLVSGLKAIGEVKQPFVMVILGAAVNLGVSWYLGVEMKFGLSGIWAGYIGDMIFRSVVGMWCWKRHEKRRDYPVWYV